MTTTEKQIIEKALDPILGELGSDQYLFVMYSTKRVVKDQKWYVTVTLNIAVTLFQNAFYVLIKRTGVRFAKYIYPRLLKELLKQFPLNKVMEIAEDLTHIGNPQNELDDHLEVVIAAQLQLLNPHLTINDAKDFLNTLGQLVIENPPTIFNT